MLATEVALPDEISGNRFSGKSVDSPKTTWPLPPDWLLLPPLLLPPPHAVSAIAPVTPVAMSTALPLLNFTFECLLAPHARGDGSRLTAPGSPGGLADCVAAHCSTAV